ncbi:MAG: hypothetical protein ACXAC0_04285 [Candidatus Thorarchaeota archaeon]|jgi:thioredoxin reductase
MNEYDIVIVGAGPGESLAAKEAAERGLKTVFFNSRIIHIVDSLPRTRESVENGPLRQKYLRCS